MNGLKAQQLMSLELDGELSARQRLRLERWLARHPEEAHLMKEWEELGARLRNTQSVPRQTPEVAWQDVQRAIRVAEEQETTSEFSVRHWKWGWASACCALLVLVSLSWWIQLPASPDGSGIVLRADRTLVEHVETDIPNAISMVYEDEETGLTVIWILVHENGEEDGHVG